MDKEKCEKQNICTNDYVRGYISGLERSLAEVVETAMSRARRNGVSQGHKEITDKLTEGVCVRREEGD